MVQHCSQTAQQMFGKNLPDALQAEEPIHNSLLLSIKQGNSSVSQVKGEKETLQNTRWLGSTREMLRILVGIIRYCTETQVQ